jgi:hypothetical protein
LAAASDE